jgi:hypothetical protein
VVVAVDRLHRLDVDALDLGHLSHDWVDEPGVGQLHHELVDGPPATLLEDLDPDDVAVHGADPARHLAERARPVREPDSQDEPVHGGDGTEAPVRRRHTSVTGV